LQGNPSPRSAPPPPRKSAPDFRCPAKGGEPRTQSSRSASRQVKRPEPGIGRIAAAGPGRAGTVLSRPSPGQASARDDPRPTVIFDSDGLRMSGGGAHQHRESGDDGGKARQVSAPRPCPAGPLEPCRHTR
jgi:hypothetical protein